MKPFFQYLFIIIFTTQQISAAVAYDDVLMGHSHHNSLKNFAPSKAIPLQPPQIPSKKRRTLLWLLAGASAVGALIYFGDNITRPQSMMNDAVNPNVPLPNISSENDLQVLERIHNTAVSENLPLPAARNILNINTQYTAFTGVKSFPLTLTHYPWLFNDETNLITEQHYENFANTQLKALARGQPVQFNEDLGAHDFTILDHHIAMNQSPSEVLYQIWTDLNKKNLCGLPNPQHAQSLHALQSTHNYTNFALMIHLMQSHRSELAQTLEQANALPKTRLESITRSEYDGIVWRVRHALAILVEKHPNVKKCIPFIINLRPFTHSLKESLNAVATLIRERPLAFETPLTLKIDKIDNRNLQDFHTAFSNQFSFAPKLQHLRISSIDLRTEHWALFWQLFQNKNFSYLKSLSLNFLSTPAIPYCQPTLPELNSLTLTGTPQAPLTQTSLYNLKELLKYTPLLKNLSISHSEMSEEALKVFVQSLAQRMPRTYGVFGPTNNPAPRLHVDIRNYGLPKIPYTIKARQGYKPSFKLPPAPLNARPVFNPIQHNLSTCLGASNHPLESCPYICSSGQAIHAEQISTTDLKDFIKDFEQIGFFARMTGVYERLLPKAQKSEHNVLKIIQHFLQTDNDHTCETCKDISQYVDALRGKISEFYTISLCAHRLIVDAQQHNNPRKCITHSEIDKKQCPWYTDTALKALYDFGSTPNLPQDIRLPIERTVKYFESHLLQHPYDLCQPHVEKMLHLNRSFPQTLMRHDSATCPHMQHPSFAHCAEKAQTDPQHVSYCPYLSIKIGESQSHIFDNRHQPGLCQHYHKGHPCSVNPQNPTQTAAFSSAEVIKLFRSGILLTSDASIKLPNPAHETPAPTAEVGANLQPINPLNQPQVAPLNQAINPADLISNGVSNLTAINPALGPLIGYPEVTQALKLNRTLSELPTHRQSSALVLADIKNYIMLYNLLRDSEPLKPLSSNPNLLLALILDHNLPKALLSAAPYELLTDTGRLLYDNLFSARTAFQPASDTPLMRAAMDGMRFLKQLLAANPVQFNVLTTRLLPMYQDLSVTGLHTIFNLERLPARSLAKHFSRLCQWMERYGLDKQLLPVEGAVPPADDIKQFGTNKRYFESVLKSPLTSIGLNSPRNTQLLMQTLPHVIRRELPIASQTFAITDGEFLSLLNASVLQYLARLLPPSAQKDLQRFTQDPQIIEIERVRQSPYQSSLSLAMLILTNLTGILPAPEMLLGLHVAPLVNSNLFSQETYDRLMATHLRPADLQLGTWQLTCQAAAYLPLLHKVPRYWFWSFHPYPMGLVALHHTLTSPIGPYITPLASATARAIGGFSAIAGSYYAIECFYNSLWQNPDIRSAALYGQPVPLNPYKPTIDGFMLTYPYVCTFIALNAVRPLLAPVEMIWKSLPLVLQIELGLMTTAAAYYHRDFKIPGFNQMTRWYEQGFASAVKSKSLNYYKAYPKLTLATIFATERLAYAGMTAAGASLMDLTTTDMGILLFSLSPWLSVPLQKTIKHIAETYSFKPIIDSLIDAPPIALDIPASASRAAQLLKRAQANLSLDCYSQYQIISLALYTGLIVPQVTSLTPPTAFTAWLWSSVLASEIARDPCLQGYEHLQPLVTFISYQVLNSGIQCFLNGLAPYPALYTPAVGIAAISAAQKIKQLDVDWQHWGTLALQALESLPSAPEINNLIYTSGHCVANISAYTTLIALQYLQKGFKTSLDPSRWKALMETLVQGLQITSRTLHKHLEAYCTSLNDIPLTEQERQALLECKNIIKNAHSQKIIAAVQSAYTYSSQMTTTLVTPVNKLQQLRRDFNDSCNKVQPKPAQRGFLARGLVYLAKSLIGRKSHHPTFFELRAASQK
jgi:hypothetical protein